mmetsp:Transcript_12954/g.12586  ORF Transcript_12954/g.12586 Transcript_12954/m.12586 type:complete len:283 (-) Transcript_12954:1510-2358(-)
MSQLKVDASNACVPISSKLIRSCPPLPTTVRGERSILDGACGRINSDKNLLLYPFGKLVVLREIGTDNAFVYRGHSAQVTCCKFSPSGYYVASGDIRGKLRVWSYDNEEHLCKLELSSALVGPIRDIGWDMDSKRICLVEEGDAGASCCKVIQWDTGVNCCSEPIGKHLRHRASSCSFKPNRPMRLVTGGSVKMHDVCFIQALLFAVKLTLAMHTNKLIPKELLWSDTIPLELTLPVSVLTNLFVFITALPWNYSTLSPTYTRPPFIPVLGIILKLMKIHKS